MFLQGLTSYKNCSPKRAILIAFRYFVLAEIFAVSLSLLSRGIFYWLGIEAKEQAAIQSLLDSGTPTSDIIIIAFSSIIISPIIEELFFRYCLLSLVDSKLKSRFWSIVIVSVLFSLCHFNLLVALPLFGVSVAFSMAFLSTRSILVPVFAHMLYNLTAVLIAIFSRT